MAEAPETLCLDATNQQLAASNHPSSSSPPIDQLITSNKRERGRGAQATPVEPAARWYLCETSRAGRRTNTARRGRPFNIGNHVGDGGSGAAPAPGQTDHGAEAEVAAAVTNRPSRHRITRCCSSWSPQKEKNHPEAPTEICSRKRARKKHVGWSTRK